MKRYLSVAAVIGAIGFSISALAHVSGGANSNVMPMMKQGLMGHHMHGDEHGHGHGTRGHGLMGQKGGMGPGMMGRGYSRHMMQPHRTD